MISADLGNPEQLTAGASDLDQQFIALKTPNGGF